MERGSQLDTVWQVVLPVAIVGLVAEAAIVVSTFLASEAVVPSWIVWVLLVGIFPVHLCVVLALRRRQRSGEAGRSFLRSAPRLAQVVLGTFFLFWLAGMSAFFDRGGNVEARDGRYYVNSGGELTEITKSEYHRRHRLGQRSWAAIPGGFYAVGVAVGLTIRHTSDDSATADQP